MGHRLLYGKMVHFDAKRVYRSAFQRAIIACLERFCFAMNDDVVIDDRRIRDHLERICPHSDERATVVMDLGDGFSPMRNASLACYSEMISMVQLRYPERLGKVYIIRHSAYIQTFYQLLVPFMDRKTRAKIHWVSGDEEGMQEVFLKDFEATRLPTCLGGRLEWKVPSAP